jgi:hypothetical protein
LADIHLRKGNARVHERNLLRTSACIVMLFSATVQFLAIAYYWWDFDPRLSCHRLPHWGEWLECLHGESHIYVFAIEFAVAAWLIAGVAMSLGRFAPVFLSVLLPVTATITATWLMIDYLLRHVDYHGALTLWEMVRFAGTAGLFLAYVVGPIAGAWLLGLHKRAARQSVRSFWPAKLRDAPD